MAPGLSNTFPCGRQYLVIKEELKFGPLLMTNMMRDLSHASSRQLEIADRQGAARLRKICFTC